jgi:hypothetical protein
VCKQQSTGPTALVIRIAGSLCAFGSLQNCASKAETTLYNARIAKNKGAAMLRNLPGIIVVCAIVGGCATKPPAAVVADNTPLNRTAVIEQHVASNGIKGFLPFESDSRHFVRANMRRDESTFKGTGTFTGFLVGTRYDTEITRIDRKVHWTLNTDKREYTECPLLGCTRPSKPAAKQEPAEKSPQASQEPGCTMRIAHTGFTVKATGRKKTINGFNTEEYQVAWVVKLRDNARRYSTSTVSLDIWTTPTTGTVRDVLALEESYARAYLGKVADTKEREIMPADATKLITSYLASSLKQHDLKAFLDAGRKMKSIKGYPISTHLEWNMEGNACAARETVKTEDKSSIPSSAGDLVSGLAGMFAQKKADDTMKEAAGEPILSLTFEVKKLGIEPVHDSVFTVPQNYKLVSQQ